MSPTLAFILALLATQIGLKVDLEFDKDEVKRMWEREEFLHQMSQLLQEVEGNCGTMETLLCPALKQHWLLWGSAAALVLVPMAYCLLRRRKHGSAGCREQERVKTKKTVSFKFHTEEKVGSEKFGYEKVNSKENVSSQEKELQPAAGTDSSSEAWSIQENSSTYRPLVILRPPPGHSFTPESTKQPPAGRIRVALECLCSGEQLLGQMCFLHASGGQLPRDQDWYLLDTLCTGSCLDAEKVVHWVQMLVASAWLLLPQSRYCQLTALPSSKSCSWQLSTTSGLHCRIEMDLAMQQGSSDACLSPEWAAASSASSTTMH
ncbi:hypothetical protein Nmel_001613 [Mimus melanotis]